jgi:hypothetical protein
MKKKIPCLCDNSFEIEISEEIDLDTDTGSLGEIQNGSFFSFTCPSCGKKHKPEFPIKINWPSKKLRLQVIPEQDRGEFYRNKKKEKAERSYEMIVGYPEMAERLQVICDGYDPVPIEAIKYNLQLKAEEQYPESDMEVFYYSSGSREVQHTTEPGVSSEIVLEFHIHGIRKNEVAVMKVPLSVYERTLSDYKKRPKSELFTALHFHSYLSYKNTMRPGVSFAEG